MASEPSSTDETPTKLSPFSMGSFSVDKHVYMMEFDVEKWYSAIQPYTFDTYFVGLSVDEAKALARFYKATYVDKKLLMTDSEVTLLEGVKNKIGEYVSKFAAQGKSSFVRLSSRSPKDAGFDGSASLKQLLNEEMTAFKQKGVSIDANIKLQALFNASARMMEVTTADQAMGLLLSRIYSDLIHALDEEKLGYWDMKIIIREFVKLNVSYEFRGFVCNKILTAVTQYNDLCYYPHFKGKEVEILDSIFDFFHQVRDLIDYEAYVIDFVLIGGNIKVIEINPFGPMTGASLFTWERDRYLLQGGNDIYGDLKPEVNVEPEPVPTPKQPIPVLAEFTSTKAFLGGWKTIMRVNARVPEKVNTEYINGLYGDILKSKNNETIQKLLLKNENNCIIL